MAVDIDTIQELLISMLDDQRAAKQINHMFNSFKREGEDVLHLGFAMQAFTHNLCKNDDTATASVMGFVAGVFCARISEDPEKNKIILKQSIEDYKAHASSMGNVINFPKEWN